MMNNALKRRLLLYVLCGLVVGCYDTVYFDGEEAKVLVLNAVLVEGRDSVEVMLTETKAAYDTSAWRTFPEAEVRLYEDGKEVGQGEWRLDGRFVVPVRVKEKCTYRVEAVVPDRGMVWGETTVPERLEECTLELWSPGYYTYTQRELNAVFKWRDTPGRRNVYWLYQMEAGEYQQLGWEGTFRDDTTHWRGLDSYTVDSPLPDPFNRWTTEGCSPSYEGYVRVEDAGRDGQRLELLLKGSTTCYLNRMHLLNVDVALDACFKSFYENYLYARPWGDEIPWVFHSAYVYSNVEGGTGLVASYSEEACLLRVPATGEGVLGPGVPVGR